ncbi:MAG TPA: SDR family oxidoreductase [Alphaproteobacteria bacterium]|nr:SDR family oxidoreductase [Alphaproteobacteria bacterium]
MPFAPFDLTGKTVLITGGNGGIGLGMAEGLAQAGADVVIWGTNEEKNAAALKDLEQYGTKVAAMKCNVGSEQDVEAKFAETLDFFGGKLDACFANAGVSGDRRKMKEGFGGMDYAEWRRVLDINLDGVFFTLRAAGRHMKARGEGGCLVGTSSTASIMGQARGEHYAASKGAMNAIIKALAVEYGRHGIRANAILPGWIETEMTAPAFNWDRFREAVLPRVPAGRWGTKEDFAGIAVYLVSDASRYHSGDVIVIDGAYTLF